MIKLFKKVTRLLLPNLKRLAYAEAVLEQFQLLFQNEQTSQEGECLIGSNRSHIIPLEHLDYKHVTQQDLQ